MAPNQYQCHQGAGYGIDQGQQKQYQRGSDGNQCNDQDDEQNVEKRHLSVQIELFETVIADVADHQQADTNCQRKSKDNQGIAVNRLSDAIEPDQDRR